MHNSSRLKNVIVFIVIVAIAVFLVLFAIQQFKPHSDFSIPEQKTIPAYNQVTKDVDIMEHSWAEITFIKDGELTFEVHTPSSKSLRFFYVYQMWEVLPKENGNGHKLKEVGARNYKDYDQKTLPIDQGASAEVKLDCSSLTNFEPGKSYVIEIGGEGAGDKDHGIFVYFTLDEPKDQGFSFEGIKETFQGLFAGNENNNKELYGENNSEYEDKIEEL